MAEIRSTCIYEVTTHHQPGYRHHTHIARHQDMAQPYRADRQCGVHRQVKLHPQLHNTAIKRQKMEQFFR